MSSQNLSLQDPFADSSCTEAQETTLSSAKEDHMASKGKYTLLYPYAKPEFPSTKGDTLASTRCHSDEFYEEEATHRYETAKGPEEQELPTSQPLTRIPVYQRQGQGLDPTPKRRGQTTFEPRSSIPIAIRKRSVEHPASLRNTADERFSGGIRIVEKPSGTRSRLQSDQEDTPASESVRGTITKPEGADSSSSSSIGEWDFGDGLRRPKDVYTGEYRIRPLLKIASSAEKIIMGPDSPGSDYAVTQRSNPALVVYPDTPRRSSKRGLASTGTPASSRDGSNTAKSTPGARTFNRPKISLETFPKRDISGRELAIQRKPVSSPKSLIDIFIPSLESESIPMVPKLPKPYEELMREAISSNPVTPTKIASPLSETSGLSHETTESDSTIKPLPQRTISSQAVSDFPTYNEPTSDPVSMHSTVKPRSRKEVTLETILLEGPGDDQVPQSASKTKLPDSKSNRMLGGFRNIFKPRSTQDNARNKGESTELSELASKDEISSSAKAPETPDNSKLGPGKIALKGKGKQTRLSDGWSKNIRIPRPLAGAPTRSKPTISSPMPAPPGHPFENNGPSFARPTMATRTRAIASPRIEKASAHNNLTHRSHTVTTSMGSPGLAGPSTTKKAGLPRSAGMSQLSTRKDLQKESRASASVSEMLYEIRTCIETLCNKARDEDTPAKREKYLRMALSLQQQVSDYNGAQKEVREAEHLLAQKRGDQCIAENTLFESYAQLRAQMDED
ncbi:hypothetical protein BBP40_006592 [Aspergillus hancockii]|nr:hypothetical protein BBP40_006592 [Aspergillus hancockii]